MLGYSEILHRNIHIAGVDEVGIGPIAGPVVAAAVLFQEQIPKELMMKLDDSKKLTPKMREFIFELLSDLPRVSIGVAAASVQEIAQLNIRGAAFLAMRRAIGKIFPKPDLILVDGNVAPDFGCATQCIIKGDGLSYSIAAASIIAKVVRDRLMDRLAKRWVGYGWEDNAGYPTVAHRNALQKLGVCPHHRKGFMSIRQLSFQMNQSDHQTLSLTEGL